MQINIQATTVFNQLNETTKRFVLSVGSSRSSKTYSMLQWIIVEALRRKDQGIYISIIRSSFPSLRRTVYREFVDLLKSMKLYDENSHNKTEHVIKLAGNYIEFFSLSDSQKVRGAKRNHLFLNEVNEIDYESAQQLFLRTTERVFMDMNPSDIYHWSFRMKGRYDVDYVHSTYLQNPFLTEATIKQIESYKETDDNLWRVYGLGLPGYSITTIYNTWKEYNKRQLFTKKDDELIPNYDSFVYGLDVAYSSIMALVKVYIKGDSVWWEEVIYQSQMTSNDLILTMKDLNIERNVTIWVDAAAPNVIEDLKRAGYSAVAADKDVKAGIDLVRSKALHIDSESENLIMEIRRYQWKTKNETIIYEPIKLHDHCFTGDTLIQTQFGEKKMRDINLNDKVLTSNGYEKVLKIFHNGKKQVNKYTIQSDTCTIHLECTPDHQIKTDKGWKQIQELQPGMSIFFLDNLNFAIITVNRVLSESAGEKLVYDLMIENTHEYVANGILVHNCMDAGRYATFNYYKVTKRNEAYDFNIEFLDM